MVMRLWVSRPPAEGQLNVERSRCVSCHDLLRLRNCGTDTLTPFINVFDDIRDWCQSILPHQTTLPMPPSTQRTLRLPEVKPTRSASHLVATRRAGRSENFQPARLQHFLHPGKCGSRRSIRRRFWSCGHESPPLAATLGPVLSPSRSPDDGLRWNPRADKTRGPPILRGNRMPAPPPV